MLNLLNPHKTSNPSKNRQPPGNGCVAPYAAVGCGIWRALLRLLPALVVLSIPAAAVPDPVGTLNRALDTEIQIQAESSTTQERVDRLDDETRRLLDEYRRVIAELDGARDWNDRLERSIRGQEAEIARLQRELLAAETTRRGIGPLMDRMQAVLEKFVARDLPFLPEERSARLRRLEALARAPQTAVAGRFRSLLEAYQVEGGYGYGVEAYRGRLDDGSGRLVDFLRLGRVALYYRTLDGAEAGARKSAGGGWTPLAPDQARALGHALRVARRELPPELLQLPVPAPEPETRP